MASRERDDAMAGLLKRNLAGDAGAGNHCPGPDVLAAYFERSLDAAETAHIELHLSGCARCREQLVALAHAEEAGAAPVVQAPPKAARPSRIWDWRWLAPIAAVLVIAAIWATRRPELTRITEHPNQTSATVATPLPAPEPTQDADRKTAQQDKQQPPARLIAPAPGAAPVTRQASPLTSSGTDFAVGVPAPTAENSRSTNVVVPKPAPPEDRAKKAAQQQSSADAASNSTSPSAASESATVESAAQSVAAQPAPLPAAPAPQPNVGGVIGGAAGVTSGAPSAKAQTMKEKEAPALVSAYRARPEIVAENQAGEISSERIIPTPDPKILWRIASGGFIERSEDAGATWNGTLPRSNAHFVAGSAPSAKVCWLVGDDGIILLTRDAVNWQTIPPPVREDFVAVSARNGSSAMVTTAAGDKFATINQGESWTPAK
jgi:hypothetical protein